MYDAKVRSKYVELFKTAEAGLGASLRAQLVQAAEKEPSLANAVKSAGEVTASNKSIFGGKR
jgi:hypothetical protein